MNMFM